LFHIVSALLNSGNFCAENIESSILLVNLFHVNKLAMERMEEINDSG